MCRPPGPPCPRAPAALRRRFVRAPFRDRAVPVHRPDPIAHRRAPVHSRPDCRKTGTAAAKGGITEGIPVNPARAGDHAREEIEMHHERMGPGQARRETVVSRGRPGTPRWAGDWLGSKPARGCGIERTPADFRARRGSKRRLGSAGLGSRPAAILGPAQRQSPRPLPPHRPPFGCSIPGASDQSLCAVAGSNGRPQTSARGVGRARIKAGARLRDRTRPGLPRAAWNGLGSRPPAILGPAHGPALALFHLIGRLSAVPPPARLSR